MKRFKPYLIFVCIPYLIFVFYPFLLRSPFRAKDSPRFC